MKPTKERCLHLANVIERALRLKIRDSRKKQEQPTQFQRLLCASQPLAQEV